MIWKGKKSGILSFIQLSILVNACVIVNKGELKILISTFCPQICVSFSTRQEAAGCMMPF